MTELYANDASTVVVSGGQTTPVAGTVETWNVRSSSSFPGASASAGTGFHVSDTVLPSEVIQVTKVSGTTWTVVRGAEATVPVAHAIGFTVRQVISAGVLGTYQVTVLPSGDTTGAADVANINGAADLLFNNGTGGVVYLAPGDYYINNTIVLPQQTNSPSWYPVSLRGSRGATVIHQGSACTTGIYMHRTTGYTGQNNSPSNIGRQGAIIDLTLDGTNAPSGAIGMDVGDGWGGRVDATVSNFDTVGAIGFLFINRTMWTEKWRLTLDLINCHTGIVADCSTFATGSSHEYNDFDLYFYLLGAYNEGGAGGGSKTGSSQNGMIWKNGSYLGSGSLRMRGSLGGYGTPQTVYTVSNVTVANPGVFTISGSTYATNQCIQLFGNDPPGGLISGLPYYVKDVGVGGAGTFTLAELPSLSSIQTTSTGSGITAATSTGVMLAVYGEVTVTNGTFLTTHYNVEYDIVVETDGSPGAGVGPVFMVLGNTVKTGNPNHISGHGIISPQLASTATTTGWTPSIFNGNSYAAVTGFLSNDSTLTAPNVPNVPSSGHSVTNNGPDAIVTVVTHGASSVNINLNGTSLGSAFLGPVYVKQQATIGLGNYSGGPPTWTWAPIST
jgi:hypothetical protein